MANTEFADFPAIDSIVSGDKLYIWDASEDVTIKDKQATPAQFITYIEATATAFAKLAADNPFTGQNTFTNAAFPVLQGERTSAVTNLIGSSTATKHTSSGVPADNFGAGHVFQIEGDGLAVTNIGRIAAVRDGADTQGKLVFSVNSTFDQVLTIGTGGDVLWSIGGNHDLSGGTLSLDDFAGQQIAPDGGGLTYGVPTNDTHDFQVNSVSLFEIAAEALDFKTSEIINFVLDVDDTGNSILNLQGTSIASTGETDGVKFLREDGDGSCSWQQVDNLILPVRKGSAGTITSGTPVYLSGWNPSGFVEVETADADDPTKMPAIGIAGGNITNGATVFLVGIGLLEGMVTNGFSVGDQLYVSTSGTITSTRPTGADAGIQKIGTVIRSHVSMGVIAVAGALRANDIPNVLAFVDTTASPDTAGELQRNGNNLEWHDGTAAREVLTGTSSPIGVHDMPVPASSMWPTTTEGTAPISQAELGAAGHKLDVFYFEHDSTAADTRNQFRTPLPRNYNNLTVTATVNWYQTSGSGDVIWALRAIAVSAGTAIATNFGTATESSPDTAGTANTLEQTAIGAVTIGGSPTDADDIHWEIYRAGSQAGDTFSGTANLLGIVLHVTTDASTAA